MAIIWFALIIVLASSSFSEAKQSKRTSCTIKVNITRCQKLGHQHTSFPNPLLTNHQSQQQYLDQMLKFLPDLYKMKCSKVDPVPFLCSVYFPKCHTTNPNNVVKPCREFCEKAVGQCAKAARSSKKFRLPAWPAELDCSRYPKEGTEKCENGKKKNIIREMKKWRRKEKKFLKKINKMKKKGKKRENRLLKLCCKLGEKAATKNLNCSLINRSSTKPFWRRAARRCKLRYEKTFADCCLKFLPRTKKRKGLKQKRKEDRKKNKEEKRKNRKQTKDEKKQKEERKQKKKERKTQKKLKKYMRNQNRG